MAAVLSAAGMTPVDSESFMIERTVEYKMPKQDIYILFLKKKTIKILKVKY